MLTRRRSSWRGVAGALVSVVALAGSGCVASKDPDSSRSQVRPGGDQPTLADESFANTIIFERSGHLYAIDAAGDLLHPLPLGTETDDPPEYPSEATWSPDGTHIAFTGGVGVSQIWSMSADGSELVRLTDGPYDSAPAWSPDGDTIVFSENRNLALVRADGTEQTRVLAPMPAWDPWNVFRSDRFAWSPDGMRVAYFSAARAGLVLVDPTDGRFRRIVRVDPIRKGWGHPQFSPDGAQIAFTCGGDVCVIDRDGTDLTRLTGGPASEGWPSWSPDGTRLLFVRSDPYGDRLFVMRADGSDVLHIANRANDPVWSPIE